MSRDREPSIPAKLSRPGPSDPIATAAPSPHGFANKLGRVLWNVVWLFLFRPVPRVVPVWHRALLTLFGARLGPGAFVHPSARIWAPWNLEMGTEACLSWGTDCYNVAPVSLGRRATVSQRAFLCAATHDITHASLPVVAKPIVVEAGAWVCAEAFVGPGVTVGEGAVVGARAVTMRNVDPWSIVVGNPARVVGRREIRPM